MSIARAPTSATARVGIPGKLLRTQGLCVSHVENKRETYL